MALKRLDDAMRDGDNIRAIIRSCGANQDGKTNGITLPSSIAQERLARKMFQGLAFAPSEVHYVEVSDGIGSNRRTLTPTLNRHMALVLKQAMLQKVRCPFHFRKLLTNIHFSGSDQESFLRRP